LHLKQKRHCAPSQHRSQFTTRKGGSPQKTARAGGGTMASQIAQRATRPAADEGLLKLEDFLPYRINVCAHAVSQALSCIYAERYKIGVPEWRILVTLGQFGMMTAKAIGRHSRMHKTKVSRAVALLERRKLVTRRTNRADLREVFLSLTPAGQAAYDELTPAAIAFAKELQNTIEPADRAPLDRALRKLTERSAQFAADLANERAPR
jgi:DNA-binding MarR family transcriptional regulator